MLHSVSTILLTVVGVALAVSLVPRIIAFVRLELATRNDNRVRRSVRAPDLEAARAYERLLSEEGAEPRIDARTWTDLDLDDVFCALDYTASEPGRQYLYHTIQHPRFRAEPLTRYDRVVREFQANTIVADSAIRSLGRLNDRRAARLVHLMFGELPERPRLWWVFPFLTLAAVSCLLAIPFWDPAPMWGVAVMALNVAAQVKYKPGVSRFVPAMHEVPAFIRTARALSQLDIESLADELRRLGDGARATASLLRATRWLSLEAGQGNDVISTIYEYVNLIFLLDVNAFVFSLHSLKASRAQLRDMFDAIGYIDAAQSVAQWRDGLTEWCAPEFTPPGKNMHVVGAVHPLVANAVPNSLNIHDRSILISGSNMAGKTTFLRALGVNAVLAQTLATACASEYHAPVLHVRTSIGRADSVMEGKSYYLAEVESVRSLLLAKETGAQHLFLLDETFRGTNTTERVAAAYAVLRYLDRGLDIVVVATHDLEVLGMLGEAYEPYHFREQFVGDQLTFDYLIQPGPSSTRNAIALLRYMKFPAELVDDAIAHLDWQQRLRNPRG